MPFITSPKTNPRQIAVSLVRWLNDGGRCPAVFDDDTVSPRQLFKLLGAYVDSWLTAGHRLRRWSQREDFKKIVRTLELHQKEREPVTTTTDWSFYRAPRPAASPVQASEPSDTTESDSWKDYEGPPDRDEEDWDEDEEREEMWREINRELAEQA